MLYLALCHFPQCDDDSQQATLLMEIKDHVQGRTSSQQTVEKFVVFFGAVNLAEMAHLRRSLQGSSPLGALSHVTWSFLDQDFLSKPFQSIKLNDG